MKLDVETGTEKVWYNEGYFPSEPVFVQAPNPESEDDGKSLIYEFFFVFFWRGGGLGGIFPI